MKKFLIILTMVLFVIPVLAENNLKPAPLNQAIREYRQLLKLDEIDPENQEVWKLHVYGYVSSDDIPLTSGTHTFNGLSFNFESYVLAGLTREPNYHVILKANNLHNQLETPPEKGDVIIVNGMVISRFSSYLKIYETKEMTSYYKPKTRKEKVDILLMLPDASSLLSPEPIQTAIIPTITTTVIPNKPSVLSGATPTIVPAVATQTVTRR